MEARVARLGFIFYWLSCSVTSETAAGVRRAAWPFQARNSASGSDGCSGKYASAWVENSHQHQFVRIQHLKDDANLSEKPLLCSLTCVSCPWVDYLCTAGTNRPLNAKSKIAALMFVPGKYLWYERGLYCCNILIISFYLHCWSNLFVICCTVISLWSRLCEYT